MTGEKNLKRLVPVLSALLCCLADCATGGSETGTGASTQAAAVLVDPPARTGAPTLLIAMPSSPNFVEVRKSLVSEVQKNFNIHTFVVGPETTAAELATVMQATNPVCVVLMNNATINLYYQVQTSNPTAKTPPAVLLMASFVEQAQARLRRATGIAYEVPGVTAFVHLRSVIGTPVNRVGVIYRPPFRAFVQRQTLLAAKEHVELVSVSVPSDVTAAGLR
jgi:hypothetical protein